jgi:hypothetical protein
MKTDYDKIILNLKKSIFLFGESFKNQNIKNKIKNIILEIEDIKKKEVKIKKQKNNLNLTLNNSKDPKKSIELIDNMIEEEKNEQNSFDEYR